MYQISRVRVLGSRQTYEVEVEHKVEKLMKWLPADPNATTERGRRHDLVQFIAKDGGIRTVRTDDLVVL